MARMQRPLQLKTILEQTSRWKRSRRSLHQRPINPLPLSHLLAWISPLPQASKSYSPRDLFFLVPIHALFPSLRMTFVHRLSKTICVIMIVSPISGPTGTFPEDTLVVHFPLHPLTDLIWTAISEIEITATDVTM